MEKLEFALAGGEDVAPVLALYHSLIGTPGCVWSAAYPDRETVEEDVRHKTLYVLKERGQVVAAAAAGAGDELEQLPWAAKQPCDLARVGVLPARQNQGLGGRLLGLVFDAVKARGFDGVRLLVSKTNPAAIKLYEKAGVVRRGEARMHEIDFYCYELVF